MKAGTIYCPPEDGKHVMKPLNISEDGGGAGEVGGLALNGEKAQERRDLKKNRPLSPR